jgi:PD-(D/E)XK endonuclease
MTDTWTPRKQGDAGERSAVEWLWSVGAHVFIPFGHSPDYDVVADFGGGALRVQVKTTTRRLKNRWHAMLCTRGGNQSWNGTVKTLDASRCDYVFIHAGDGRRWFIPATDLGGGSAILLGGPRYAAFEVERGQPLQARNQATDYTDPPSAG